MSRFPQGVGTRGSQKWIQLAANEASPRSLDKLILPRLGNAKEITWCSPLADDQFSEYRDDAFLDKLNIGSLSDELKNFWPARGPQWDALGLSNAGDVLLVEAKAHIDEMFSPASMAGEGSIKKIEDALSQTALAMGAKPRFPWTEIFYQLANRLAHLHFLREHSVKAWLILVNFIGDEDMHGPMSPEEWMAAYRVAWHVLGVSPNHGLSRYVIDCYPIAK